MQILANRDTQRVEGTTSKEEEEKQICFNWHKNPVQIFQVTGEFCLDCWQMITYLNI